MIRTRESVYKDGNGWSDPLHWYAIAVRELQKRAIDDRTSWRFLAGIHGADEGLWRIFGFLGSGEHFPADSIEFWNSCQHGSWYFLPWHRGYLSAFERIVRAAVVAQGGPEEWALPYWNYSDETFARARTIPSAFTEETMPDGTPNALYSPFRFGPGSSGTLTVPSSGVSLSALGEPKFGSEEQIPGGFGGGRWPVAHNGGAPGMLEGTPHGPVHTAIGGGGMVDGQRVSGLMGTFETAGLDPIFWLHHCNIDRLWEVWLQRNSTHTNPVRQAWLGGPADRPFVMPDRAGDRWDFACLDVVDTTAAPLEYIYDDTSDPLAAVAGLSESLAGTTNLREGAVDWEERDTELIAAREEPLPLGPEGGAADVPVPGALLRGAADKMLAESTTPGEVERYFLLLDDVRGPDNAGIYEVYVDYGEPGGTLLSGLPRAYLVGMLATFGIDSKSDAEGADTPGLSQLYNITPVIERMGFDEVPSLDRLHVNLLPVAQNSDMPAPTIGRMAIYRETG